MQQTFEQAVYAYMEEHDMIPEGSVVHAAVSGGADSVCLLALLCRYRQRRHFELRVIHVEHGIRGEPAREDARFVKELCAALGLPCRTVSVDAPGCAAERGLSLEEAARICRYGAFEELAGAEGARIALAHHREDQAETVLFNLARGSGLAGLGGMRPVRGSFIRPLLESSRQEIEAFLREAGAAWREDGTNTDLRFTRNLIRHSVLPVLSREVNTQTVRHICEAARRAREAAECLERIALRFCEAHMRGPLPEEDRGGVPAAEAAGGGRVVLDVDPLRGEEPVIREYVLRRAVRTAHGGRGLKDIGAVHIADLDSLLYKPRGKHLDLPGLLKAERVGRTLVLYREERGVCAKEGEQ